MIWGAVMFKQKRIQLLPVLLSVLVLAFSFQPVAFAQYESSAGSALLMEASTGKIIYEKEADIAKPPASITKLMTLLLVFEAVEKGQATWEDMVPISEKAWKIEGSRMFLEVGTKVSYRDIVTGISVVSANDGCIALAEYLYGSESSFVQMMNKKAVELGMTKTKFQNATGLPAADHYMSARDIATLTKHLLEKYPEILEIESMREYTFNNILQYNRNPLLNHFPGADGLKTGWTTEAGYCLVGTAIQNGVRLIAVILNTESENQRLLASQELLNYGFKNFMFVDATIPGTIVGEAPVEEGKASTVPIRIDSSAKVFIPVNTKDKLTYELKRNPDSLLAPVTEGTVVGEYLVKYEGRIEASIPVVTAEGMEKAGFLELMLRRIGAFFKNLFAKKAAA